MSNKNLHIAICDKFIPPFIDFIEDNFDSSQHQFLLLSGMTENDLKPNSNVFLATNRISRLRYYVQASIKMHQADKIILHALFDGRLMRLLFFMPWLLKKSYWVMWGADFYFPEKQGRIKKQVIKKMGHCVTYIKGDYELVQQWYGAKGQYHECFMYPSNLYKGRDIKPKEQATINIQLGNSADPTNNHIDILEKLTKYKDEDIKIFAPLSYGDKAHAKNVIAKGEEIFGDKFISLTELMPSEKYLDFLCDIDIAIFAHKRQQAMGNTITLLGLGKKVYMRSDVTQWDFFQSHGIKVFDVETLQTFGITEQMECDKVCNQNKIKKYFSVERYTS